MYYPNFVVAILEIDHNFEPPTEKDDSLHTTRSTKTRAIRKDITICSDAKEIEIESEIGKEKKGKGRKRKGRLRGLRYSTWNNFCTRYVWAREL